MVLARMFMVTSAYIIGKGNLPFRINLFDKALLPSAFRTGQLRASLVFLERKSVFSHSSSFFINAVRAVCSCCSFAGYPCLLNCKLQILQGANRVAHCSLSYSPLLIFLITLLVVRLTNIYITDLSDRPTSFPAWMASAVENKAGTLSSNSFFCGSMLSINMNLCMFE